jgi:hypothetical protein
MNNGPSDWLDELLRDAARTYNRPPDDSRMPLDDIWREVDAQVFGAGRRTRPRAYWLAIAAALVVGIGIGRLSLWRVRTPASGIVSATTPQPAPIDSGSALRSPEPLDPVTSRYLGQAAALLIALPSETNVRAPDRPFIRRANELLLTTRLLLDSQASRDPSLRNLLEDLELVLVQVVQLEKDRARARQTELDLIQQALEQRDVIPRLRTAASEYAAD